MSPAAETPPRSMNPEATCLRERIAAVGIESLGDAELVSIVLGRGRGGTPASVLAARLLEDCSGVAGIARAGLGQLSRHAGLGIERSTRLAAAIELGRRASFAASIGPSVRLPHRAAIEAWAMPRLSALDHEELWALALDGRHGLRAARRVASGGIHGLHVSPRDALRVVLREAASCFVLVHNHPSGDPTPSDEDRAFTRAACLAATVVGIPMLDHVVVARRRAESMLDLGLLE
jgi:DNA repair protein RadC